jgi:hypothetical protein
MTRTLLVAIVVLAVFVALPLLDASRASTVRDLTGTVVGSQAGQWISVANEQTDAGGVRIVLPDRAYDGNRGSIKTGARVAVSYRLVGERYPVAVKLRVLDPRDGG